MLRARVDRPRCIGAGNCITIAPTAFDWHRGDFSKAGVADARMWASLVEELRDDHQVITVDLRGYGETPLEPGAQYSDAGDVLAVLDAVGASAVTAVGSSYGGYVVQQAASREPERFARLVLICAPTDNVEPDEELRAVWADEPMHTRVELARLMWELRKKLEPFGAGHLIENERRLGYRLRTCRPARD